MLLNRYKSSQLLFENLPIELIQQIFKYFEPHKQLSLRLVCKKWKEIIESLPEFKKELHLRLSGYQTRHYNFSTLSNTSTTFHQLSLSQIEFNQIPENVWNNIGPGLKILTFRYCLKMRLQDFHQILSFCENLEHLQIYDHFPPFGPGYDYKSYTNFTWPVKNMKKFEMFRASAVDNKKLEDFLSIMSKLEYLRIESQSYNRMEETIFKIITDKSQTIRSLFLVDNKDEAGGDDTLLRLISLNDNHVSDTKDVWNENQMEVQYTLGPRLLTFGCRLSDCHVSLPLRKFIECYPAIRDFEVWTDEAVLDPKFLFDMFALSQNLRKIVIHCDQNDKTFTRDEVKMYQQRKLKKIVFFPD